MNSDVLNRQNPVGATSRGTRQASWVILGTICALIIGFFAWSARPGWLGMRTWRAEDAYYNQLVRGFRAGQLDLKTEVPAGLAQLADPYDPLANAEYLLVDGHPLWDLSYYHGKLYFYFGVTPALVLFWPYAVLTGHYLGHKDAVVVFCAIGFLASVGLLCALWRRYFPEVGVAVVAAGTLALGLAGFTPVILPRAEIYEVAIGCSYALAMLALLALWMACHRPQQRGRWLAAASLAYGLAVGARPTALFGAVILLVPVVQAWREGRMQKEEGRRKNEEGRSQRSEASDKQQATRPPAAVLLRRTGNLAQSQILVLLLAATGPITCLGLGLMLYNTLRFENPLEFGQPYLLASVRFAHAWSYHFLGANFWVYFLAPARWSAHFPFVQDIKLPPLPDGYGNCEHPFGVLTSNPLVWLALAAPLAWRDRSADGRRILRGFLVAVALLFAARALVLGLFLNGSLRYEVDFCPALVLLAVVGILGLERTLVSRLAWRWVARCAWGLLLAISLAFNLLASAIYHAEYHSRLGSLLLDRGQVDEAVEHLQKAVVLQPDDAANHYNLGAVFAKQGQSDEAIHQLKETLRLKPDDADAHNHLGEALAMKGQVGAAISQLREALRLKPDNADAHNNLGIALGQDGRTSEAIPEFREALRLKPDHAEAHNHLGVALFKQGQVDEAISHYQQALRLRPHHAGVRDNLGAALIKKGQVDEAISQFREAGRLKPMDANMHNNLGAALEQKGQIDEAIVQYQQAIHLKVDYADAHNNLGHALLKKGQIDTVIGEFQETVRLKPADAEAHYNLGIALFRKGQIDEAIRHYQEALRLKPDYASAYNNLGAAFMSKGQIDEAIGQFQHALRLKPDQANPHNNLGIALGQNGRTSEAIREFREALRLNPDYANARTNLEAALATQAAALPPPGAATNR